MNSLYKSETGKNTILNLYDQKLESLNIEYRSEIVNTSFGKTHVLIAGQPENPPLILIHGANGCAPIALETYFSTIDHYQVFAIDVLAQPNKSEGQRLSMKDDSYGRWMNELIVQLDLKDVKMASFSFGGLIILKTLAYNEERIKEVFLSAPAHIVNGNLLKLLFKMFLPMKRYMKTAKPKYLEKFLIQIFSEEDKFALNYLAAVFLQFEMDFTPVPIISKSEASKIRTPIHLFAAEHDIIFPGKKMIKRAERMFPSLKNVTLLQQSKHVQSRSDNTKIQSAIIKE